MKLLIALALISCASHPTSQPAASPPAGPQAAPVAHAATLTGRWSGTVSLPGQPLAIDITFGDDGKSTIDVPAQGAVGLPLSKISLTGDAVAFELEAVGATFHGTLHGDAIAGTMAQSGQSFAFTLTRKPAGAEASTHPAIRTCRDKPTDAVAPPYRTVEVAIDSTGGTRLAGTLTLPAVTSPAPAVVLVTGSGPQDRDECVFGVRPFRQLADHLARHGIASLRYDDRGTAQSTGVFAGATPDDFAADAAAAVRFLAARAEINVHRIGILGHSEGGIIAPLVATTSSAVSFIVLWASPGLPMETVDLDQTEKMLRADGAPAEAIARKVMLERTTLAALRASHDDTSFAAALRTAANQVPPVDRAAMGDLDAWVARMVRDNGGPWMRWYLDYVPAATLAKVTCPVLALGGSLDTQVPAHDNLEAIRAALGRNRQVTVRELAGLNHLFQRATTGGPSEYISLAPTIDDAVLDATSVWIAERRPK